MASKKYRLIISPTAEQDLDNLVEWYELKQEGLGERFYHNFSGLILLILKNPFLYAKILYHFRKAIISPFPYSLYYSVNEEKEVVKVIAIIHHARSKKYIQKRLKW